MSLLLRAAAFAKAAHGSQRRKYTDLPYVQHPLRVGSRALLLPEASEELAAAGFLHDVIEDTARTYEDIRNAFGDYVAGIVLELTQPEKSVGNRDFRKNLYHDRLKTASREARLLKLLDRLDNLREMGPDGFMVVYTRESRHLLEAIGFTDDSLSNELDLVIKNFEVKHGG
jgi:(p)ppGpp synthase/HD superfamily hydrolase